MYDVTIENPAVCGSYRTGPYAKSREQFFSKRRRGEWVFAATLMRHGMGVAGRRGDSFG